MPRTVRPRALAVLASALAASVLPVLPSAPTLAQEAAAAGFRVVSTTPVLTERLAAPASGTAPRVAPVPDRRSYSRTSTGGDAALGAAPRSVWRVTYDAGFQRDAVARAEFQRAVDTWANLVGSRVPITVDARFRALERRVLGSAGPGGFVEEVEDDRYGPDESALPVALGNAIAGRDLIPPSSGTAGFDIVATFPNNNPDIYYGRGPVPRDKYDFYSTALHEIGHGLGFTSTLDVSNGTGSYGFSPALPYKLDFDRFVTRGVSGTADVVALPNRSSELAAALTSRNLYWRGSKAVAAHGGRRPKLFAPSPYLDGSSVAHLDEDAYPTGTANALMTPSGEPGEQNRDVGDVALGMLADIGWSVPVPGGAPAPTASPSATPTRPAPTATPTSAAPTAPAPVQPGSRFTPLTPTRLLDTRTGLGLGGGAVRLGDDATVDLTVVGGRTGVPAGATAVVLNVTAVGATRATDVRVYATPRDGAVPTVSNINLGAQQTRAGVVTVPVGAGGQVRLRNEDGQVSLLADLAGFYARDAQAAFHPVAPVRLLDTRTQQVPKLGPGGTLDLVVAGVQGVPASASAVVLNVTGVAPTRSTDLAVYPATARTDPPSTSNVNLVPGAPVPNLVVVKVGDGGKVRIRNSSGSTAVLVDLSGWFHASAPGGQLFRPVSPVRLFDTRTETDPARRRLGPGGRGVYRTTTGPGAVPTSATAGLLNVTGVSADGPTDVRVYPASASSVPVVSNLNLGRGQTVANAVVVQLGQQGDLVFRNNSSSVALLSDLAGWFGP